MLAAEREQLIAGGERVRRGRTLVRARRLGLIAAHDETATDRVIVFFTQHTVRCTERGEPHAVGMPRQPLVMHEEQLHRLIEGDLVLAEEPQPAAGADTPYRRFDGIGIDGLGVSALEPGKDRPVGAVTDTGERERSIEPYRDLLRRSEEPVALQAERELACRAHRPHGVGARGTDAHLEDIEDA
jgi:hypothetical protein